MDEPLGQRSSADRRTKRAVGLLVVAVSFIALLTTLDRIPLTDDADAYLTAAIRYAEWGGRLLRGDGSTLTQSVADQYWSFNSEHPPVAKAAMGLSWWIFHDRLRWLDQIDAARLATLAFSTWLAWLVFSLSWDYVGRLAAIAAPVFLLTVPQFFFHSHVETLDVAAAATMFFAFSAFVRGLRSRAWSIACGFAFGLAVLTKLNAPFLFAACALFTLWSGPDRAGAIRGLVSMAAVAPLMFVAGWPWLWWDTAARVSEYLRFHLEHYGILFFYFGQVYDEPPAPWHAPFVMTAITTPPLTIALAIAGTIQALRRLRTRDVGMLVLLGAAAAIVPAALPGVPKYGGVKLFLPLFPFLAVLAGWGLASCVGWLRARTPPHPSRRFLAPVILGIALMPGVVAVARIHPYGLSYYSPAIGGLAGAVRLGFERQYYDLMYPELLEWFSTNLAQGTRITFQPNNKEYMRNGRWLWPEGRIRSDLKFAEFDDAEVLVLTHERRWPQYPALLGQFRSLPVLWQLEVERVPLLTVYRLDRSAILR